jgi:hypothetical protein
MTGEQNLDGFLSNYRIITETVEAYDITTERTYNVVNISLEQKKQKPKGYFTRGAIPYLCPTENNNAFVLGISGGITADHVNFLAGTTYLRNLGMEMFYDLNEVRDAEYGTVKYTPGQQNMYGAFKVLFDNYSVLSEYPVFYSITGGNDPYPVSSFSGITERGASAGCYTLVNFGGTITPFQLMFNASSLGISHNNGLPTGTGGNPLYFGLPIYQGVTAAIKSMYFTPNIHASLIRNITLLGLYGVTFVGYLANLNPYQQFIKFADDDFQDTQTNLVSRYLGSTGNPAWISELKRFAGSTALAYNSVGYELSKDFIDRFMQEIKLYPAKYGMGRNSYNIGHLYLPYATEILGWSALIPTPGVATDATGPYAPAGDYYVTRLAGLTVYPAPSGYTYSVGVSGWQTYRYATGLTTQYFNDYFMLGGPSAAASATYEASRILPVNILTYFQDTAAGLGPDGKTMDFLRSYYYDLYQETVKYGGYLYANVYPINFIPRFNPLIPVQNVGTYSALNTRARRDCTIHPDFGLTSNERKYNLKQSMAATIKAATRTWKLMLDNVQKYNYRIMPVIRGRSEDLDLTRGGSVPYTPTDFVQYIIEPLFSGDVPANGFIFVDDVHERLLNDFYYGNIGRSAAEYSVVITNRGVSGASIPTSFIRGLETYFFNLEELQDNMSYGSYLIDLGLTMANNNFNEYSTVLNSGRFSDYRVFESNTSPYGGNTQIPYGNTYEFRWYLVPLRSDCIMSTNQELRSRWLSSTNNNIDTAYRIMRDAYFELTKQQLAAAYAYFNSSNITTFVEYRATDKAIGR